MKPRSSIETITDLFMSIIFQIARRQHPEVEDDVDLLPHVCDLLRLANTRYQQSLVAGLSDSEAVYDVCLLFAEIDPTLRLRSRYWFW